MIPKRTGASEIRLTPREHERYLRQISLSEIGECGQHRLRSARILCIGLGGLGSPATIYLAAAGIGTLGLIDPDLVGRSNLHRQILFGEGDLGRSKVEVAETKLRSINPDCNIVAHDGAFTPDNALEIAQNYDLIIDGTDNFSTRYLSNDASIELGIPNVYASIYKFEGQVSVFAPPIGGGCYRCMFPTPPPAGLVPNCAEGGVLGTIAGIVGTIQATEALKLVLGQGTPLAGRLLHIDALRMKFRHFQLRKDPDCPSCGVRTLVISETDYGFDCSLDCSSQAQDSTGRSISPAKLAEKIGAEPCLIVDLRSTAEYSHSSIPTSVSIPFPELPDAISQLRNDAEIIFYCRTGDRSREASKMLARNGFINTFDLRGGIVAWASEIDETLDVL